MKLLFFQIEELESILKLRDETIAEQRSNLQYLSNEFDVYKQKFNSSTNEKLSQELSLASHKILELENTIRKLNKSREEVHLLISSNICLF